MQRCALTLSSSFPPQPLSFEWCAYLVNGVQVGAHGREELHRRHLAVRRSQMEGRVAILRGGKEGDAARAMQ